MIGASTEDKFASDSERPQRSAHIDPVALGKFPVTVGEYREFRSAHAPEEADDLPVVQVSWQDAQAFCAWLSSGTGQSWRLPREDEWEVACRAGSDTPFSTGHQLTPGDANFLYDESGARVGPGARKPVGCYPANAWGFHDLHGNVAEWCEDPWTSDPDENRRIVRGGAWDLLPRLLRSSARDALPAHARRDNVGFRVALALPIAP
jgi:formylglycine-generating enzyme required for sulfatase activity